MDALDATLTNLKRIVNTQEPLETYKANISKASTIVEEIKGMIEMEPMDHTGN